MTKRKTFGKLLVVSLFIMLFVLLLTLSTSAATHDVATEAELTAALEGAADGDTINVTADITVTSPITVGKQLTIAGNGHTLTASDAVEKLFTVNSALTVTDLSLNGTKNGSALFYAESADSNGSVTVSGTNAESKVSLSATHVIWVGDKGTLSVELGANVTVSAKNELAYVSTSSATASSITVSGAEVTSGGHGVLLYGTSKLNVTVKSGTLTSANHMVSAGNSAEANLTVSGGKLSSTGNWFANYTDAAKGSLTYSGGEIDVSTNHHIVNFGSGKVDFTMTGGTLKNRESTIYYENKTTTAATKSNVSITGGTITGNYFNIDRTSNVDIEFGGTANVNLTATQSIFYHNSATGSVTVGGQATISVSQFFFRTRQTANASLTINGGTVTAKSHLVVSGDSSTSAVTFNGGTVNAGGDMVMAVGVGVNSTVTVTGGSLTSTDYFLYYGEKTKGSATIGGSGTITTTNGIYTGSAEANVDLTIQDSVVCTFSANNAININGTSPTITIQGNAQIISKATLSDREIFNIVNGANPTIYVKDNVKFETPNNLWGHAFRIGTPDGNQPANATIYVQGSTVAGEKGIDIDVSRGLDLRTKSSAYIQVTGRVDLNSDCGPFRAHGTAKSVEVHVLGNDVSFTNGAEEPFYFNANKVVFTLEGDHTMASSTGHFLWVGGANADANTPHTVTLTGNFNFATPSSNTASSCFYVENPAKAVINVSARKDNTTDKFVFNGGRVFNFRANTNVDFCINTNEINATTAERLGYTVSTAYVKVEMLTPKATYKAGGSDHFILCNGGANGDVTLKLTGITSLTTPEKLISFIAVNASNDVSITMEMADGATPYSVVGTKHGDNKLRPVMDLAYNTTGNVSVSMKGNYTFTGFTDFFTFYNPTGAIDIDLNGDFTYQGSGQFFYAEKIASADVDLVGNFNFQSSTVFWITNSVSGLCSFTVTPREGNTTDAFNFTGWRVLNLRQNTNTNVSITTNSSKITTSGGGFSYAVGVAKSILEVNAQSMVLSTNKENSFIYDAGSKDVTFKLSGNFTVDAGGVNFLYVADNAKATVTVDGADDKDTDTGFVLTNANRFTNMRSGVTGSVTVTGKANIAVTEKAVYHVDNAVDITLNGDITVSTTANDWLISNNCEGTTTHANHGTHTIKILGNTKLICAGNTVIQANGPRDLTVIVGGNTEITTTGQTVHLYGGASGSITVQDSAKLSGNQLLAEGNGKIDLTIKGTPTFNLTSTYNGINHKATGEANIIYSGVWSTNKTIFHTGGKKNVSIIGADTVITCQAIYADAGSELIVTVADATVNSASGAGIFTASNGGIMNVTVNSGKLTNSNKFIASAHGASKLYVTVNGGEHYSNSFSYQYQNTASGSITYNGGSITAKDHHIVNFGSGKVDFTMIGGSVTAPASLLWYENKDSNAATKSNVQISGGTATGGFMNLFKTSAIDVTIEGDATVNITGKGIYYHDSAKGNITVGGNAKLNITNGWALTYENTASGSVTLKGNAAVTGNEHGFVNNGTAKVDFTIQDNASLTITRYTTVYYGGHFPAGVVNEINIKGGSITAVQDAILFPGSGEFVLNISGGHVTTPGNAIYIGSASTNKSTFTVNVSGGTVSSTGNDAMEVVARDAITVDMTVSGGTFHGKKMDLQYGSGYPLSFSGKNNTLTVTGGSFIADYAHAALMVAGGANGTVYGGYLEGGALCTARATEGGTLNVYGGTFYYTGKTNSGGMVIRSGTGSGVGNVNIYGGNLYTNGTGTIFCLVRSDSNLTLYGGFNAWGGQGLLDNGNKDTNVGHGIGDMWTYAGVTMSTGAAVRIVESSSGLRFMGLVSAETVAHYESIADAGSIVYGTLIAPVDYVQQLDYFTKEALDAAGLKYLNLIAENGLIKMEDGSYQIRSAITNIKEENRDREFAAVCYVTYTVDGNQVTTYAVYREVKNARSIEQVARLALQDGRRYNESQLAILNELAPEGEAPVIDLYLIAGQSNAAGSTKFSEAFRESDEAFTEGYANIYYSGTAAGGTYFASKNYVEVDLVKAGYGGDKIYGMGAELGMAKALSQYYNEETGRTAAIIKYGYGGTALADTIGGQNFPEGSWTSPSWLAEHGKKDEYKSGGLYRAFVKQIESSISDYRAMGYDVNIVAAYWMQGESDRTNANYAAMFEAWVNDLRADVYGMTGDEGDQSLPVMVGEISYAYNPGNMHYNPAFIAMQNEMANTIDNLYIINQSPLATANTRGDTGHWSCDDMLLIGQMVATTALNEIVLGEEDEKYKMPYLTGTPVAEVYDAEGNLIETYSSLSWAIGTAPAGATVKLLGDLTIYGPLGICNPNRITVDGQGYMIDVKTDQGDAMKLIQTDIVLNNFNIKNHSTTEWGLQTYNGAKFIWNGGSFEAESIGIVMNDNAIGQLHNVNVSVRNGVEGHAAAIYMGNQNADIWVNGGSVTGTGTAEAIRALNGYVTVTGEAVITGGTNTTYAISQRDFNGYLAIGDKVTVNGAIGNNGTGYLEGEDVVELPSPELPEESVDPELPEEPELPDDSVLPEPETPEEITPDDSENTDAPEPVLPENPDEENPDEQEPTAPETSEDDTPVEDAPAA